MTGWRWLGLLIGATAVLLLFTMAASASPDPPKVDGGSVEFNGDWTVDPFDSLEYVNETIVLNGNLTVEQDGHLDLTNCTLVMNCTSDGGYGIEVKGGGQLLVDTHSLITYGLSHSRFLWTVRANGYGELVSSNLTGAGWNASNPGLVLESGYNDLENSSFTDCWCAITGVGSWDTVSYIKVSRCVLGLHWMGTDANLLEIDCDNCTSAAIWLDSALRIGVLGLAARDCGEGLIAPAGCDAVTVRDCTLNGLDVGINASCTHLVLEHVTAAGCDPALWVRGQGARADGVVINGTNQNGTPGTGVIWGSSGSSLIDVRCEGCYLAGVWLVSCSHVTIANLTAEKGGDGLRAGSDCDAITVSGCALSSLAVGIKASCTNLTVSDLLASGCDPAVWIGGSHAIARNVTVTAGGPADPAPVAGVRVTGPLSLVSLQDLTVSGCRDAVLVEGEVTTVTIIHLKVTSAIDGAVALDGAGSGISDVRAVDLDLYLAGASYGLFATHASDVIVDLAKVAGPPLMGFRLESCSRVALSNVTARAVQRVISADGGGTSSDLTVRDSKLDRGQYSVWLQAIARVIVDNCTLTNSSLDHLLANDVLGLRVSGCTVKDGARAAIEATWCNELVLESSVLSGTPYFIYVADSTCATVRQCFLTDGVLGVLLQRCDRATLDLVTVRRTTVGFRLNATTSISVLECDSRDAEDAYVLESATAGCTLWNCSATSSTTAVRLLDGATGDTVTGLVVSDCVYGVVASAAGDGNVLRGSALADLDIGVSAALGTRFLVDGGSFDNCTVAMRSDSTSLMNWTVSGASHLVNCSANLTGRFDVTGSGSLEVSGCNVTFASRSGASVGIWTQPGATLRLLRGTSMGSFLWGTGSAPAYRIDALGPLEIAHCSFDRGTWSIEPPTVTAAGDAATVSYSTFRGSVTLVLSGAYPLVSNCSFWGYSHFRDPCLLLNSTLQPTIAGCDFHTPLLTSPGFWGDLMGEFSGTLVVRASSFEGQGGTSMGMAVRSPRDSRSVLSLSNATFSGHGTSDTWGLWDAVDGSTLLDECVFESSSAYFMADKAGDPNPLSVHLHRVSATESDIGGHPESFIVEDCDFGNTTLWFEGCPQGGLARDCTFTGGSSHVTISGSQYVTLSRLDMVSPSYGLSVINGSDVDALDCRITGATVLAVDVNGSLLSMEQCALENLSGSGVNVWGASSRLEMTNCTIASTAGRAGSDVVATQGSEAFLLNTTFDETSVLSVGGGRVEVLWYVTFDLRFPWGGSLLAPQVFSITDATGAEVVNTSDPRGVFLLYEFVDDNGVRTMRTPHDVHVEDAGSGVRFSGTVVIDRSEHIVLDLLDIQPPVALAGPDQRVPEDSVVVLDGRASSDNDPRLATSGNYTWSFDEYGTPIVLFGARVDYVFSVPGTFNITLTVRDMARNVGQDTMTLQVVDISPPVIRFGGNVTIAEDVKWTFDASATTDNDPGFDTSMGRFVWTFDMPDGPVTLEGATVALAFDRPGNYTATLAAYDMAGNRAQSSFWVHVLDRTPPRIMGVRDMVVFAPSNGLLDASASTDNVGITSYRWTVRYGNGTVELDGPAPSYNFNRLGLYEVSLTLSDAADNLNSTTVTIVYDDVPVIALPPTTVAMAMEGMSVPINVTDSFHTQLVLRIVSGPVDANIVGGPFDTRLVWTPSLGNENGTVTFEIEVHDGYVGTIGRVTVFVNPARGTGNHPPVITSFPPLGARRSTPYIYSVKAFDPDGDRLGFSLLDGPAGMTVSTDGVISWDPPFDSGTIVLGVRLAVTDGRALVTQQWQIRFREPPNQPPRILFDLPGLEVKVREEFSVDLSTFLPDAAAFTVDPDDQNLVLRWTVTYDDSIVQLLSQDGLVFRFRALDVPTALDLRFNVFDPSGANDSTAMRLAILPLAHVTGKTPLWPWMLVAIIIILVAGGGGLAVTRRGRRIAAEEAREEAGEGVVEERESERGAEAPTFALPPEGEPGTEATVAAGAVGAAAATTPASPMHPMGVEEEKEELEVEMDLDELLADVGAFEEIPTPKATPAAQAPRAPTGKAPRAPAVARPVHEEVVVPPPAAAVRPFVVDGVAVLGKNGRPFVMTGHVEDVLAPVRDAVSGLLASGASSSDTTIEVEGRRVVVAVLGGLGLVCVIRGKEDAELRPQLMEALARLPSDPRKEATVAVVEELVSSAAAGAQIVKGAWTAHLRAAVGYKDASVALGVLLRNDTDSTMHGVRLELAYDHDALLVGAVKPKLLVSQDRVSVGNLAPGKALELEVSLAAELCLSSQVKVTASYTDAEGRRVVVPGRPLTVEVKVPSLRPAGAVPDAQLLALSTGGLAHSGRRAFTHALDAPRGGINDIAVRKAKAAGLGIVREIDEPELMRTETWLLGEGASGVPSQLVARISSHGTDHLLEVFVASDDAASVVGLLAHLSMEVLDAVRSGMPSAAIDRLRDARLLNDLEVWPTLLEYKLEGD